MSTQYMPPRYVERAYELAETGSNIKSLTEALADMTAKHDALLQQIYRTIDNYGDLLQTHGPYHEVELGEPLSRFENILRKALNE
jgi:ABC-type transporter Mla subunit MlaD